MGDAPGVLLQHPAVRNAATEGDRVMDRAQAGGSDDVPTQVRRSRNGAHDDG